VRITAFVAVAGRVGWLVVEILLCLCPFRYAQTADKLQLLWDKKLLRNTVHADDMAAALWLCCTKARTGAVYNIADPNHTSEWFARMAWREVAYATKQPLWLTCVRNVMTVSPGQHRRVVWQDFWDQDRIPRKDCVQPCTCTYAPVVVLCHGVIPFGYPYCVDVTQVRMDTVVETANENHLRPWLDMLRVRSRCCLHAV